MIKKIKQSILFKNTFIYVFLQLINKGVPFLLLPLLTHFLSPKDYGMLSTYNTFIGVIFVFINLSMSGAVGVSYFYLKKDELKKYIGNILNILLISTTLVIFYIILLQPYIKNKIGLPVVWLYIAVIVALAQTITNINLVLWRSQHMAKQYAIYEISQTLFNILLSLLFVVGMNLGWEGRAIGISSAIIIFGFISMILMYARDYIKFNYSKKHTKDALKFGIPLIPHEMALWMRSGINILLINTIDGVSETGLYSVGLQFGMVVGLFANAFNNAYSPYLYEKLQKSTPKIKNNLVKFTYVYFVAIIIFAMLLSSFFVWLIPLFLGEKFQNVSEFIYWISLAYAFQGMYLMVVNYIFYAKKNHLISIVTISTSIFHVVLSYFLIHRYGAIGAAYASVVSFFVTFILVWKISTRVIQMPWFDFIIWRH